jgi:DNA-binding transcriptional LysR family regulator
MMLFCSNGYAARHGLPVTIDDLEGHHYLEQRGAGLSPDLALSIGGENLFSRSVALTVDSSFALFTAVAGGLGIGALPTYARAVSRQLRPLDLPVRLRFDVWMSYDASVRDRAVTKHCVDWMKACFDQAQFPWFGDRFLHPDSFDSQFDDPFTQTFFDGMIDR